jgi:hypothetical protein
VHSIKVADEAHFIREEVVMKEFIVICASIVLAIFIFNLIMGDGDTSIKTVTKNVWEQQIGQQRTYP